MRLAACNVHWIPFDEKFDSSKYGESSIRKTCAAVSRHEDVERAAKRQKQDERKCTQRASKLEVLRTAATQECIEHVKTWSAAQIKAFAAKHGIDVTQCLEKPDFLKIIEKLDRD